MKSERALRISMCTLLQPCKYPTAMGRMRLITRPVWPPQRKMSSLLCYAVSLTYSLLGSADSGSTLGLLAPAIDGFGCSCSVVGQIVFALEAPVPVMMRGPALIGRLICMGITVGRRSLVWLMLSSVFCSVMHVKRKSCPP